MNWNPRTLDPSQIPDVWDPISYDVAQRLKPDQYGMYTKQQRQLMDEIRAARWLLLRNERRARCRHCNQIHEYITRFCIERPFRTMDEILFFERQQAKERGLIHGENIILTETTWKEIRLGVPVPISKKQAQRLMLRIRAKGGRKAI